MLDELPNNAQIRYLRATLNQRIGNSNKAAEDYNFLIERNLADAEIYNNLGILYAEQKKYEEAVNLFTKAVEQDGASAQSHNNLSEVLMRMKDYKRAIEEYNKVLSLEPENITALYNLGFAYEKNGDHAKAKEEWEKILALKHGFKYSKYASKLPELNISMDYISDWIFNEHRGPEKNASGVLFFENIKGDIFKAKISLYAKKFEGAEIPLEASAQDLITKRLKFKDSKVISKSKSKVCGLEAYEIVLSYKTLDKLYAVDAKSIPVKERIYIFNRAGKFYTLRYDNRKEKFGLYDKAFTHIVISLRFTDQLK